MTNSFDARRAVLRRRLQAQREVLGSQVSTDARDSRYPRSLTMSLLRGRSSVAGWALRELVPLLVLHYLGKSGSSLLQALRGSDFSVRDASYGAGAGTGAGAGAVRSKS